MLQRGRQVVTLAAILSAVLAILRTAARSRSVAAVRTARERMSRAVRAGDTVTYAKQFSATAVTLTPAGVGLEGSAALESATRASIAGSRILDAGTQTASVREVKSTIVEEGYFWLELERKPAVVRSAGRFTAVWKRERGQWKIVFEAARVTES